MNLTDLETAVKRYGFDDSDPISTWVNAAMFDVAAATDWPWLEELLSPIALASGSQLISLPSDLAKIISLRDITNLVKIDYMNRRAFERDIQDPASTGQPQYYTLVGSNNIQIYPTSDGNYNVALYYQREIASLVNPTDVPDMPERTHYAIVLGAVRYALIAESEEERAQAAETTYNDALGRLMTFYGMRELDDPAQVQDTAGYGDDGS